MDLFQVLASIAGIMIVLSTLPQVLKTLKTKDVSSLSLPMFLMIWSAQLMWLAYGIHINDLPLIITNAGSSFIVFINVFLILKYRDGKITN